ncbi:MAG: hypothetical protein M1838_001514 [Thelocarpon superellum]|nr:MAG: hypothetical protein M1838_001514 [Thelocarpon superellum]
MSAPIESPVPLAAVALTLLMTILYIRQRIVSPVQTEGRLQEAKESTSTAGAQRRDLHEIADQTPIKGKVVYGVLALCALAILIYCLAQRAKSLNVGSVRKMKMNVIPTLVFLIYAIALCFIFSGAILQLGIGLNTLGRCRTAIGLCLVFYVGGKVVLYIFLVERAHAIRSSRYGRTQDAIWISGMLIVLIGFGTIATLAFIEPVYEISPVDGRCRIGLPFRITLPLLIYDILINLIMTVTFFILLRPFMRNGMPRFTPTWMVQLFRRVQRRLHLRPSSIDPTQSALDHRGVLERLAWKSFIACLAVLVPTVANLSILFYMSGREQGWLCFTACTIDGAGTISVTWSVIVIHLLTSDPAEMEHKGQPAAGPRSSMWSNGSSEERGCGSGSGSGVVLTRIATNES